MPISGLKDPRTLRPHQKHALAAASATLTGKRRPRGKGVKTRLLTVIPTGGGKTFVFTTALAQLLAEGRIGEYIASGRRVAVVVDRDTLVRQAVRDIRSVAPDATIAIVQGNKPWDSAADVLVVSIQSVGRLESQLARRVAMGFVDLIIADEAHHAASDSWITFFDHMGWKGRRWENGDWVSCSPVPVWGFTATPGRSDTRKLVGPGGVFEELSYEKPLLELIEEGLLVNPIGEEMLLHDLDLESVKRSRGDLQSAGIEDAFVNADAGNVVAAGLWSNETYRARRIGVFLPGGDSTKEWTKDFAAVGFTAEYILEETSSYCELPDRGQPCCGVCREAIFERFRTGETQVLLSCDALTEGWDAPWCDMVVIARPTQSKWRYRQMAGRALRLFPEGGKRDAIVLHVLAETKVLSLCDLSDLVDEELDVAPGESLMGAKRRRMLDNDLDKGEYGFEPETKTLSGETVITKIDLFPESPTVWLKTLEGEILFIPAGKRYAQGRSGPLAFVEYNGMHFECAGSYIFLWMMPNYTWRVKRMPQNGSRARKSAITLERDLTYEDAKSWAQYYAALEDPTVSTKGRAWRKNTQISPAQERQLTRFGLQHGVDYVNRGEASDQLSIRFASIALDKK
jgi:superfamily II DNA or RNA helicase